MHGGEGAGIPAQAGGLVMAAAMRSIFWGTATCDAGPFPGGLAGKGHPGVMVVDRPP